MSKRITVLEFEGNRIYYTDWKNLVQEAEFVEAIRETAAFVLQLNEGKLLEIVDVTGSAVSVGAIQAIMKAARDTKPVSRKKAVLGVNGPKLSVLNAINQMTFQDIRAFETQEEALRWLVA